MTNPEALVPVTREDKRLAEDLIRTWVLCGADEQEWPHILARGFAEHRHRLAHSAAPASGELVEEVAKMIARFDDDLTTDEAKALAGWIIPLILRARDAEVAAWLRHPDRRKLIPMPDRVIPAYVDEDGFEWSGRRDKVSRLPTAADYADAIEAGEVGR